MASDIQLACSGSLTIVDVGSTRQSYELIPSRRDPPPEKEVSYASGLAIVNESTSDCSVLAAKYGLMFTPGVMIEVNFRSDGWLDLARVYKGTSQSFEWKHSIYLQNKAGELPLFPNFAKETISLSLPRGLALKNKGFHYVDTQKIYGSLPTKTVAERVAAIEEFSSMIDSNPDWSGAREVDPWIEVAAHVLKPNNYYEESMSNTDPILVSALNTYAAFILDLVAGIPELDMINDHRGGSLINSYANLICFGLGKWINAPISNKVDAINSTPLLLHPDIVVNLVYVVENLSPQHWKQILTTAKSRIAKGGQTGEVQTAILTALSKTQWIGIPQVVYSEIAAILHGND